MTQEQQLWQAAVLRGIMDAVGCLGGCGTERDVRKAQAWLGSRDFFICCHYAGIDGHAILDRYRAGKITKETFRKERMAAE